MSNPEIPLLSFCIATRNRGTYLRETLQNILADAEGHPVEVVLVDGASTDDTRAIVREIAVHHRALRYFRETVNSGIDGDYDKAVGYARGKYCWLMSDDDLLVDGAVGTILTACAHDPTLIVANAAIYDAAIVEVLEERRWKGTADRTYAPTEQEALFAEVGDYLSFIGGVIIRRDVWMQRERREYYGSMFVHVGVIFQKALPADAVVLARPLVKIRYGNASWTARGFEIWMCKWPDLVWSFVRFSAAARARVVPRHPWKRPGLLLLYRALGGYSVHEYDLLRRTRDMSLRDSVYAWMIARLPGWFVFWIVRAYVHWRRPDASTTLVDLSNSPFYPRRASLATLRVS